MKQVRITPIRRHTYPDLIAEYENPIAHTCDMTLGTVFISKDAKRPDGFCSAAWRILEPYVKTLAEGGGNFYDGWMKNPYSAMLSCDDGFRPVTYLVETIEE